MRKSRFYFVAVAVTALLSGCSFIDNDVMPTLTGEDPAREPVQSGESVSIPPSEAEQNPNPTLSSAPLPPQVGTGSYETQPVTPGAATGTYVGQKVAQLRGDLERLQGSINGHNQELQQQRQQMAQDSSTYYTQVATINSRLQLGTTPGNPELVAQWNQAQSELDRLSGDIVKLNALSNSTASDSALAAYILESVRAAYGLQGAVDEDHRQLHVLENDCNRTVVLIDRLLNDLNDDIGRQGNYVTNERRNLTTLSLAIKNGELYGGSLANRAFGMAAPQTSSGIAADGEPSESGQEPLMVIRFDRPNVAYEQALYNAVSRALERRPSATFNVVAVAPSNGGAGRVALNTDSSKRDADAVVRSLTSMGLPAERIRLSATTSNAAQTNEVQLFVR